MDNHNKDNCITSQKLLKETLFVTWVGLAVNIMLAGLKFFLGTWSKSAALVADGVHSLSDTVTDVVVIVGAKYWTAPADDKHPYGHGRLENLLSGLIGFVLILIAFGMGYNAFEVFCSKNFTVPHPVGLITALVAIAVKEILYRWTYMTGKRLKSKGLMANAWHHRSDSFSSMSVALVLAICLVFGEKFAFLDIAGSIVVTVFIAYAGFKIMREAFEVLTDKCAEEEVLTKIVKLSLAISAVTDVHAVRTRVLGGSVFVDMHIVVPREMSVYDGHNVAGEVKKCLKENISEIADVVVHIEPDA